MRSKGELFFEELAEKRPLEIATRKNLDAIANLYSRVKKQGAQSSGLEEVLSAGYWAQNSQIADEILGFLKIYNLIKLWFEKGKLAKLKLSDVNSKSRKELFDLASRAIEGGDVQERAPMAAEFFCGLLKEFCFGDVVALKRAVTRISCNEEVFKVFCSLEQGMSTFLPVKHELYSVAELGDIQKLHSSAPADPRFLCLYSVNLGYFNKYFNQIVAASKASSATGGSVTVNVVREKGGEADKDIMEYESIVEAIRLTSVGSSRYNLQINEEWRSSTWRNAKTYYACSRFLRARENIEDLKCPIFFPDADSMPMNSIQKFLKSFDSWSCGIGVTRGIRAIYPWRRTLASQLFINKESGLDVLHNVENFMLSQGGAEKNWFLDQNAIFDAVSSMCGQTNDFKVFDQGESGFPFIQKRNTTSFA